MRDSLFRKALRASLRWLLAGGCICLGLLMFFYFGIFGIIPAAGLGVASILLITPETAAPIAEFIGECWGNLFFPSAQLHKPPLSYILADHYNNQERYAEAVIEYQKILRFYPKERKANVELILLCKKMGEAKLLEKYERRFKKRFQSKGRLRKSRKNRSWF